jgi:hypothetical protein
VCAGNGAEGFAPGCHSNTEHVIEPGLADLLLARKGNQANGKDAGYHPVNRWKWGSHERSRRLHRDLPKPTTACLPPLRFEHIVKFT